MSRKIDGAQLGRLIRVPANDTLAETESGVWAGTVTFNCEWKEVFRLMPRRDSSKHPDFNFLKCTGSTVTKGKGGVAVIVSSYAGGMTSGTGSPGGANSPIIEVSNTATEEPIETHPDFEEFAGTPDSPLWTGVFDDDERFAGFPRTDGSGNLCPFFGVDSYLAARTVVRRTTQATSQPTSTPVGMLESPPTGGGDYLKTEHSWTKTGGAYTVIEEWLGPPDDGIWNPYIYAS